MHGLSHYLCLHLGPKSDLLFHIDEDSVSIRLVLPWNMLDGVACDYS
jgi:hypothetical protein